MIRSTLLAIALTISATAASAKPEAPGAPPISEAQVLSEFQDNAADIKRKVALLRLKIATLAASTSQ